jgi:hypothetical protein
MMPEIELFATTHVADVVEVMKNAFRLMIIHGR